MTKPEVYKAFMKSFNNKFETSPQCAPNNSNAICCRSKPETQFIKRLGSSLEVGCGCDCRNKLRRVPLS